MQTVGEVLRSEREQKGLTIKEIETATSIRALYINAIEEDNYTIIPGEVYLKGFIRNYANYLGLDGREMVNLYRQTQMPAPPENTNIAPDTLQTTAEQPIREKNKTNKWLIISLLALCVSGSAWWLLDSPKPSQEPKAANETQPAPTIPAQPVPQQSTAPSAQAKPVVITAKYTEQCWTSIVADGKNIYEGIPNAGDTITWDAQQNIIIKAGNAGGIDIVYNGQTMGKLGAKGEVVVKTFMAKQ